MATESTKSPKKVRTIKLYNGSVYEGQVDEAGKFSGKGTFRWPDGMVYEGQFKDGKRSGLGIQTWPNGMKYDGHWKDDRRNGFGTLSWADGTFFTGHYKDDVRNGKGTIYDQTCKPIKTGVWKDGEFVNSQQPEALYNLTGTPKATDNYIQQNMPINIFRESPEQKKRNIKIGLIVFCVLLAISVIGALLSSNDPVETLDINIMTGVKTYLKESYLRDPFSYRSIDWSKVGTDEYGRYYVRHIFTGTNAFGARVKQDKIFYLNKSFQVVDIEDCYAGPIH